MLTHDGFLHAARRRDSPERLVIGEFAADLLDAMNPGHPWSGWFESAVATTGSTPV